MSDVSQAVEAWRAAEQIKLEEGMVLKGVQRYRAEIETAKERGREDTTTYGRYLVAAMVDKVSQGIKDFMCAAASGKPGRRSSAVKYLAQVDPDVAAYIALSTALSNASTFSPLSTLAHRIALMIEDEVRLADVREQDKKLYANLMRKAAKRDDYRNKRVTLVYTLGKRGVTWDNWPVADKHLLGLKLIDIIIETTGLLETHVVKVAANKSRQEVRASEKALDWITNHVEGESLIRPHYEPMVVPPKDWTGPTSGGYLTSFKRPLTLVKARPIGYRRELELIPMPDVYAAVNAAQRTAWQINPKIFTLLEMLWEGGSTLGGLPPSEGVPIPPKPHDIETNLEARREWRTAAHAAHLKNREITSRQLQMAMTVDTARRYAKYPAIYFPHQMDFRGRLYAVTAFTPQGPDPMKGLLRFAEGKPLDDESAAWLGIHLANLGEFEDVHKRSLEERAQWAYDHADDIVACAEDPFANTMWTEADKPFQFLAACYEWAEWLEHGEGTLSYLPIALDGSCSGIQHFSMAFKDEVGGSAVNLTPRDLPADIYSEVMAKAYDTMRRDASKMDDPDAADEAIKEAEYATQWLRFKPGRSAFKRPTMTYGYGSRRYGFRDQILADTLRPARAEYEAGERDEWPFDDDGYGAANYLAGVIFEAVEGTVVKAAEAMNWLQGVARLTANNGLPVRWTTPDGFPVLQAYRELSKRRVKTSIAGSTVKITVTEETPEINKRAQAQGISPNVIHSLDATHLRVATLAAYREGIRSFALVHDSFGTHAADTGRFFMLLRETLVEMYEDNNVMEDIVEEIVGQLPEDAREKVPPLPECGNLDRMQVLESAFCFA